ncbi:hypothetical protein M0I35_RS19370 [Providencia rettgeri]|nr:hypothetical protein [Providencia rettgeri]
MNVSISSCFDSQIKSLLFFIASFISLNAYSSAKEHSGTITFTGNVVNAPCLMSHELSSRLRIGCLDEQSKMKTEYVDIHRLSRTTKIIELSNQLGNYQFKWLGNSNKTGLIKVQYQ